MQFTPITLQTYREKVSSQRTRKSEPRDTIHKELVAAFLDAGIPVAIAGTDDAGNVIGFTWNDLDEKIQNAVTGAGKPMSIDSVTSVINQTQNRGGKNLKNPGWHVYAQTVTNPDGKSKGFVLVNERLEAEMVAQANTDANADADADADADTQAA